MVSVSLKLVGQKLIVSWQVSLSQDNWGQEMLLHISADAVGAGLWCPSPLTQPRTSMGTAMSFCSAQEVVLWSWPRRAPAVVPCEGICKSCVGAGGCLCTCNLIPNTQRSFMGYRQTRALCRGIATHEHVDLKQCVFVSIIYITYTLCLLQTDTMCICHTQVCYKENSTWTHHDPKGLTPPVWVLNNRCDSNHNVKREKFKSSLISVLLISFPAAWNHSYLKCKAMQEPASTLSSWRVLLAGCWMSEASWTVVAPSLPTHPLHPGPASAPGDCSL